MNRGPTIFLGVFLTFAFAWFGLVFAPYVQLQGTDPVKLDSGDTYPREPVGEVARGRKVYQAMGCLYCHSQQVRPEPFGADIKRGWGDRRSVPLDYIYDRPVLLGTMRTGPDLANIGKRWDAVKQHKHLYNPRFELADSVMPAFRFLYEWKDSSEVTLDDVQTGLEKRIDKTKPDDPEPWNWPTEKGKHLVPGVDARALVAYLLSLKRDAELPKAKKP